MKQSNDKPVAIVTGAASGIGLHMTKTLSRMGYQLMATDINAQRLADCFSASDQRIVMPHDISSAEDWKKVVQKTISSFGRLDYLLNIAAIIEPGFVFNVSDESIDRHIDINTKGTFYGIRQASEIMVKQGFGHIINIASLAGVAPIYGISLYSASKYAVRGYSLAIAQELRTKNVYCTVICPDLVDTPMLDQQLHFDEETALTFSGSKPLSVQDVEQAIMKAIRTKPLEICIPTSRGFTAKLANFLPELSFMLKKQLISKGKKNLARLKEDRNGRH